MPGLVVRKRHGTVMGLAGDPDLYGAYRGAHFEFEVKRPNDPASHLTKLQAERIDEWKAGGAVVGVVKAKPPPTDAVPPLSAEDASVCP